MQCRFKGKVKVKLSDRTKIILHVFIYKVVRIINLISRDHHYHHPIKFHLFNLISKISYIKIQLRLKKMSQFFNYILKPYIPLYNLKFIYTFI